MDGLEITILIFLLMGLVGVIIWFALTKQEYNECQNSESPYCPKFSCGTDPSTTHPDCKGNPDNTSYVPYRNINGTIECQSQPTATAIYS